MATASLNNTGLAVSTPNDSIVIVENFEMIRGGRTLDTATFTPAVINSGHIVIRSTVDPKDYKPMPLNGGATAYASLPANHAYVGVVTASILTSRPFASIMVRGTVNPVASPYDPSGIQAAVIAAVPGLLFRAD